MTYPVWRQGIQEAHRHLEQGRAELAEKLLLTVSETAEQKEAFARQAQQLLSQNGYPASALRLVEGVLDQIPQNIPVNLMRVRLLMALGNLPAAGEALCALQGSTTTPEFWKVYGNYHNTTGDFHSGLECLAKAEQSGGSDTDICVMKTFALRQLGQPVQALASVEKGLEIQSDHLTLNLQKIRILLQIEGPSLALSQSTNLFRRFEDNLPVRTLHAECLDAAGQFADLRAFLEETVVLFPQQTRLHARIIRDELRRGSASGALEYAEHARKIAPEDQYIELSYARSLFRVGRVGEAITLLRDRMESGRFLPDVAVDLAEQFLALGDPGNALKHMRRGLARFPMQPVLISIAVRRAVLEDPVAARELFEQTFLPYFQAVAATRLRAHLMEAACDFPGALITLKQVPAAQRNADYAAQKARLLRQSNRLETAARYLRVCLRRWPQDPALVSVVAGVFGRTGRWADALSVIVPRGEPVDGAPGNILMFLAMIYANVEDFGTALKLLKRGISEGYLPSYDLLLNLLLGLSSRGQANRVATMLHDCRSALVARRPHMQAGYVGQLMNEATIEMKSDGNGAFRPVAAGNAAAHAALVMDHPGSNFSAIRMFHHWQRSVPASCRITAPRIPRCVFQYWNTGKPPEIIADMIASWRDAPDYRHVLFDRVSASGYLAEIGPSWVRAFRMASNPAEEADFLRLCLLAKEGGIYADADDILTGSLDQLVDRGAGLVLMRETLSSNVANNFIAAEPGHPALQLAAKLACEALLSGSSESTWSKTGPGLVTRAVARHIALCVDKGEEADLVCLDYADVVGDLAFHNPAPHKKHASDWRNFGRSENGASFLGLLQELAAA